MIGLSNPVRDRIAKTHVAIGDVVEARIASICSRELSEGDLENRIASDGQLTYEVRELARAQREGTGADVRAALLQLAVTATLLAERATRPHTLPPTRRGRRQTMHDRHLFDGNAQSPEGMDPTVTRIAAAIETDLASDLTADWPSEWFEGAAVAAIAAWIGGSLEVRAT